MLEDANNNDSGKGNIVNDVPVIKKKKLESIRKLVSFPGQMINSCTDRDSKFHIEKLFEECEKIIDSDCNTEKIGQIIQKLMMS